MTLGPNLTTTEARTAPQAPGKPPLPTDLAGLKLEVIRKRVDWGRARRSGGGGLASLMAMVGWLLARLNTLLPLRAFQHYGRQHGPLMSAGIGFRMFFSITGLLATGFSLAGLFLSGQPALLDQIIKSVAMTAPGLLQVDGSEGLVDPYALLNPTSLGWAAVIAAVVTVFTSLGWISGIRDGLRGMMQLGPRGMNPVLQILLDVGTLILLGVALVISAAVSLVFGTAADWVTEQLSLDPLLAGPLTTSVTILVPLLLGWGTALIMFRVAAGLKPARRALLEGDHPRRGGHHRAADLQHPAAGQCRQEPHSGALRHHHRPADLVQPGQPGLRHLRRVGGHPGAGPQLGAGHHHHRVGRPARPAGQNAGGAPAQADLMVRRVQASRYWSAHAEIIFPARAAWPLAVNR